MLKRPARSRTRWALIGVAFACGLVVLAGDQTSSAVDAKARPTCAPLRFDFEIDPTIALQDSGPDLDCIPPMYLDPVGPEKHVVPLRTTR